jgi:hypothetical protein
MANLLPRLWRVSNDIPVFALPCETLTKQGGTMPIELKAEAVRLFAEIGYLGLGRGQAGLSEIIFDMLSSLRPGEEAGAVGAALSALAQNRPDTAIRLLRAAEQTPAVLAFAAMAHARLGEAAKARALVEDLEAMGADKTLLEMAQAALASG